MLGHRFSPQHQRGNVYIKIKKCIFVSFSETRQHYVALALLKTHDVHQAVLKLIKMCLLLLPKG